MTPDERLEPGDVTLAWLLDLERLDRDVLRGRSPHYSKRRNLFGGQVAAQSIAAAAATAPAEHHAHSYHLYFLRPGQIGEPVVYYVDRVRDGGSFTTRNVVARQDGEAIMTLSVSFHRDEPGVADYHPPVADVPRPGDPALGAPVDHGDDRGAGYAPMELVAVPATEERDGRVHVRRWMRMREDLGEPGLLHACALAYMSDTSTGDAPMRAAGGSFEGVIMTSLDYAMHFLRPIRADDWVLLDFDATSVGAGRGLTRALLHGADGRLGASLSQELLMRVPRGS